MGKILELATRKRLGEAEKLLNKPDQYLDAVLDAWIEEKPKKWEKLRFIPRRYGVEVVDGDGKPVESWSWQAIEIAGIFLEYGHERLAKIVDEEAGSEGEKDEAEVDVTVNVDVDQDDEADEEED